MSNGECEVGRPIATADSVITLHNSQFTNLVLFLHIAGLASA
jgi:hypothetical protein